MENVERNMSMSCSGNPKYCKGFVYHQRMWTQVSVALTLKKASKKNDSEYVKKKVNTNDTFNNRIVNPKIVKWNVTIANEVELHHLETSPPTLQDIRSVNGSNDEIFLDDIKKASEDKERENDEDEDGDKDNKAGYGCAKKHVGEFG
ncbi:hypothetical protein RFI_40288 [Reticulomyxa filosa]|uniref:Uncharacterized protein n=1 Tax=Reticulomyxa filosa TaxID=46433 RepID=X6L7F9_RETFI|nr:hypothetical protein RFI_40288 [Reticulomyxa filosa]|eukprot:ETN97243.1 hypothetical protein RFI_40288 [Reticulomyxa filosa]